MNTLKDLDKLYCESLTSTFDQLQKSHIRISNNYLFDLTKTDVTEAIIERLKTYYATQNNIKMFLEKRYAAAASDFFVETTLFFLRLYLYSQGDRLKVYSEKQIKRTKNSIRPDISIWNGDEVVAIIECKTQFGWARDNWEQDYNNRTLKLKSNYPNAKSFLLVMTSINWGGFGLHTNLNKQFFCLLNDIWPVEYVSSDQVVTPIEKLFEQL